MNQPSSAAAPPSPLPRTTPDETREAERARRRRQDRRHAARTVEALSGREGEAVAVLLEATGGTAWPWPRHVHKLVAQRLGISARAASDFLAAIRRTIGLPLLAGDRDGPLVKTPEWRHMAMETGDFGELTPLRTPDALGDNA